MTLLELGAAIPIQQFIVVLGTPIDGFGFCGPFPTRQAAEAWAEMQDYQVEWWVVPLARPLATVTAIREG